MDTVLNIELLALLAFMIVGSLVAVEVRDLLSSIICVGAVGFGLALIDLFLGAPDLAITQVVVEILALVILLRVVLTREDRTHETPKDTLTVGATALVLGGLVAAAIFVMADMEPFGRPLFGREGRVATVPAEVKPPAEDEFGPVETRTAGEQYMAHQVENINRREKTGASNTIGAILLDYRAYDTLGEATVIFVSIIGAYAVLRKVGRLKRGGGPSLEKEGTADA